MEFGVHSSLHKNCHHQITYAKFSLKIYYPPPCEWEVWYYQNANIENIRKTIREFSRERRFANSDFNEKVYLFNKTIKNIASNYIPHETIICNDRDPPWINNNIKKLINDKNRAYASYCLNENNSSPLQFLQSRLNSLIEKSKLKYYACLSKKAIRYRDQFEIVLVYINDISE